MPNVVFIVNSNPLTDVLINDLFDNNCDGILNDPPFKIGEFGPAGGFVFHTTNKGHHGLEAARKDIEVPFKGSASYTWGCRGDNANTVTFINLPDATQLLTDIGSGKMNTNNILKACSTQNISAKLASEFESDSGYNDWFLPSIGELDAMYTHLKENDIGNFSPVNYWSSSESLAYTAWFKDFGNGNMFAYYKNLSCKTRPVRNF